MTQSNAQVALLVAATHVSGMPVSPAEVMELAEQYLAWLEKNG